MGVKDLWQLLAPIGRRISIETLEGKSLAIDMSIWLTQFIKAMRDEEGKMIKNAHLIGTLRRILKLLFHKVRPIFVFDGATPSLKAYIMQKRRRTYERHESNKRAAVHRMILNQLKKQLTEARKITEEKKDANKDDQYASGFTAPSRTDESQQSPEKSVSDEQPKGVVQSSSSYLMEDTNDLEKDETIEWTSGYENLKAKDLDSHAYQSDSEDGEQEFFLPDDTRELSADVLAALPLQMRKQIIEELRRKERIRSRSNYIPVAENPALYSQTQLANFLKTSKLNRKFHQVQTALSEKEDKNQGKQIAAEGKKRYRYIDINELKNGSSSKRESWEDDINDSEDDEEDHAKDDENENSFSDWRDQMNHQRKRKALEDESEDDMEPERSRKFRRLQKGNQNVVNQPDLPIDEPIDISDTMEEELEPPMLPKDDGNYSPNRGGLLVEEKEEKPRIQPTTSIQRQDDVVRADAGDSGFYDNIHQMDSDEDNEFNDVDWEAEDKEDNNEEEEVEEEPDILDELLKLKNKNVSVIVEVTETETEKKVQFEPIPTINFLPNENSNLSHLSDYSEITSSNQFDQQQSSAASSSTINRAIATASGMADWAGRVVRRVLKEHLPKESSSSTQLKPSELVPSVVDSTSLLKSDTIESKLSNRSVPTPDLPFLKDSKSSSGPVWNRITEQISLTQEGEQMEEEIKIKTEQYQNKTTEVSLIAKTEKISPEKEKDEFLDNDWMNEEDRQLYERILQEEETAAMVSSSSDANMMDEDNLKKIIANSSRDTEKITEEMKEQVMELIHAFDLPYIIAPYEAEAQCAVLEQLGLVDGVVTEDSDSFLFGAEAVYKNIFNDKKFVEVYLAEDARRELGLKREDFIALAYFLGSDYTEGIHGIGIVNSMEIIQAFPIEVNEEEGSVQGILKSLQKFKEWLQGYDFVKDILEEMKAKELKRQQKQKQNQEKHQKKRKKKRTKEESEEDEEKEEVTMEETEEKSDEDNENQKEKNNLLIAFDKKHKNGRSKWVLPESFPDPRIAQEYFQPMTNRDNEKFLWKYPSKEKVKQYCSRVLGWTDNEVEAQITPVLQKFSEKTVQTRIDQHFLTYHDNTRFAKIASERLTSAVAQITGKSSNLALLGPAKPSHRRKYSSTSSVPAKKLSNQQDL